MQQSQCPVFSHLEMSGFDIANPFNKGVLIVILPVLLDMLAQK